MRKILLTVLSIVLCGCRINHTISDTKVVLDTYCTITLYDSSNQDILDHCFDLCTKYDAIFSMQNKKSELYQLNHNENKYKPHTVSSELYKVLQMGYKYSKMTDGLFDITIGSVSALWDFNSNNPEVPDQEDITDALKHVGYQNIVLDNNTVTYKDKKTMIDLGSVAKGYIADQLKEYLVSNDIDSALINLGGNIVCVGSKENEDFKIGIDNPKDTSTQIIKLSVSDLSVVTSGTYQRCFEKDGKSYHHLLNPKTGDPIDNQLSSVSIVCENSLLADTLSTVCFALGKDKGLKLINSLDNTEACFIDENNNLYYSNNFKKYVIKE